MASELLLEIGCEEVPARMVGPTLGQLKKKASALLEKAKIAHGDLHTFGAPRRLALVVDQVSERQDPREERKLGPFTAQAFQEDGAPTKAALGFARSCGVDVNDLAREETPKGERLVFINKIEGKAATEVLPGILVELVTSLEFEKSMRWGEGSIRFIRPIHWLLAVFSGKALDFELSGIRSDSVSRGHRFTHPGELAIISSKDYVEKLEKNNVIPDPEKRRRIIEEDAHNLAHELGGELYPDPALLDEVKDLVEFPVVVHGRFHENYLELPVPVVVSAMRTHQRYFAVRKPGTQDELLPFFITVANTPARDMSVVARGNQRVLGARLADAEFYWSEDLKTGIENMREQTSGMTFYKTLGSYLDKTERVEELCRAICEAIFPGESEVKEDAAFAARYCKADLVSQMVGEFPELQGVMGAEYIKRAEDFQAGGHRELIAEAVREHYLPRSAEDIAGGVFPCTTAGDALSMADKLDSVVSCWAAGLAPTGSGDPFALRRQVQGVINIIMAKGYGLCLPPVTEKAARLISERTEANEGELCGQVIEFLLGRFRAQLLDQGYEYDVVDACTAVWSGDLKDTMYKIEAMTRMKQRPDFDDLMIAFRRVMNIVERPGKADPDMFQEESEAVLYAEYTRVLSTVEPLLAAGDFDRALEIMGGLKPAVDSFFDQVLVNTEDQAIKNNRHALCSMVAELFKRVADFSKIVIQGEKRAKQEGEESNG